MKSTWRMYPAPPGDFRLITSSQESLLATTQSTLIDTAREQEQQAFKSGDVLTVSSAHLVHDMYSSFISPLLPILIENLSLTKTLAGTLTVFYQGPSLIQPLIGHLGDRVNLRMLVVLAPAISAMMMTMLGVAPAYGWLALLLIVAGLSSAGLHSIGPVLVGLLSGRSLGRGMSFWMVAGEFARTIGPVILVAGVQWLTPRGLPWLMIGGIVASVVLFFRIKEVPGYPPRRGTGASWGQAYAHIRPIFFPLAAVVGTRAMLFSALTAFLPTFLTEEGANLWLAGASLSLMEAAGVVGALSGGLLSDRLGRRRILLIMTVAAPLAVALFLNVGGWAQLAVLLLVGLTLLSTTPVMMALVQERAPESRALANGIFMALNFVTTSLAVVIVGAMGDSFGLRTAIYASIGVMLAGVPFVFLLPE